MSNEQIEPQERYGSRLAQMFGYVTPEDRNRWQQQRAQNKASMSATKQGAKSTMSSLMEFGDRNINAKLNAAHRIADQQRFDQSHNKVLSTRVDPKTQSLVESVDYQFKGKDQSIDPDVELIDDGFEM